MTYKIAGNTLTLQPERSKWINKKDYGTDGDAHSVYPSVRQFEMRWGLMSMSDFNQLQTLYNTYGVTGTTTVDLPKYGHTSWTFQTYSGVVIQEPEAGDFFEEHVNDVRLLVVRINA